MRCRPIRPCRRTGCSSRREPGARRMGPSSSRIRSEGLPAAAPVRRIDPAWRARLESPLNAIACFEIQSDEPEVAARFYGDVVGWRITREQGMPVPYWRIETNGIRGGLLQRPARTPPPECGTNRLVCSVQAADIDATT